jgi:hypothetical protein
MHKDHPIADCTRGLHAHVFLACIFPQAPAGRAMALSKAWADAAVGAMSPARTSIFNSIQARTITFGSDCSGADAAFTSAQMWCKLGGNIPSNEFCSEAPLHQGSQCPILFTSLNHPPKIMFIDMLMRAHSGFCFYSNGVVPVPKDLDFYSAGTMCTDFSGLNTLNPKQSLGCYLHFFCYVHSWSQCVCLL